MDLTERKKQILKRVVEDYIAAAEPVGSKALAEEMGGSVSSATSLQTWSKWATLSSRTRPPDACRRRKVTACTSTS